jgi:hypothetical protein
MALSSDEIIKREIVDVLGSHTGDLMLRVFPQSSNDDQKLFENGGLTFSFEGVDYGSCDACWYINDDKTGKPKAIIALEGTDALNRNSSGNAQYQRFHHVLGAVKNGIIGVYYLKKGVDKIQEDLYGMAFFATQKESGTYLVINDLSVLKDILLLYHKTEELKQYINRYMNQMHQTFQRKFAEKYNNDWNRFAEKRSTIIKSDHVIKYAGRMKRNFTDSSQRAGHIAVGEMYLTKYYFYDKKFYYLFLKMDLEDLKYLDANKSNDKEWYLLRHEPNVEIKTMDHIHNLPAKIRQILHTIKDEPVKGEVMSLYHECTDCIVKGLRDNSMRII